MSVSRVTSFGSGIVAAGTAFACAAVWLGAFAAPVAPAPEETAGNDDNLICIGPDNVLRVPPAGSDDCPAGTRPVNLEGPNREAKKIECSNCDPWGEKTPVSSQAGSKRLAGLERRIAALEQSSLFEVLDKDGHKVMTVGPGVLALYNPGDEQAMDFIYATSDGGYFLARNSDRTLAATMGVSGRLGGLRILEGGAVRVDLGRQPASNFVLRISGPKSMAAGIGESRAGSGTLQVADAAGAVRASLSITDGKGAVGLFGSDSTAVASMTEGATAGGLLVLGDRNGTPMVKFGVNEGRYGAVLTGPRAGFPYVPRSGLPGSYFFGCAAGPGCKQ